MPRCDNVGGFYMIVLRLEFHQNRLSGFGAIGGRNLSFPISPSQFVLPPSPLTIISLCNSLYYRISCDQQQQQQQQQQYPY